MKKAGGISLFDTENATLEDKRKYLEQVIAVGEDIRGVLKDQIKYLKVGIGVKHYKVSQRKNQVKSWFKSTANDLEWIFDTRMKAAKFRHSYSIPIESFGSPKLTYINTMSYEEQLEDLDRTMKRGIWKLEKMLKELTPTDAPSSRVEGDYVAGDKIGRDKNTAGRDTNVNNFRTSKKKKELSL